MEEISIDATRFAAVVVCTCGWRDIARDRVSAWELAALHLRISHIDLTAARRALQAARDARYRQCRKSIKRRANSAGAGPEHRRIGRPGRLNAPAGQRGARVKHETRPPCVERRTDSRFLKRVHSP